MTVNSDKTKAKIGKISLPKGLNREDILKKLSTGESKGFITRKGESDYSPKPADDGFGLSYAEKQKRIKALEIQEKQEKEVKKPTTQVKTKSDEVAKPFVAEVKNEVKNEIKKQAENNLNPQVQDVIPTITETALNAVKIEAKQAKEEVKKEVEAPAFSFKQGDKIISVEDIAKETSQARVDKRDKTLIEKMMKHYKYLEFDNDSEIEKLQKGLELRQALEDKRKGANSTNYDDEILVNSVSSEVDEEVVKIRREAYFSRHNKKPIKKKPISPSFVQKEIGIYDKNIVIDIARNLAIKVEIFLKKLKSYGLYLKENDVIDGDTAELIIEEMGHIVNRVKKFTAEDKIKKEQILANLKPIPPIVTIMGHVDHGKTSLLDALRKASVVENEAGGITQHIGAYQTVLENGEKITFIDTPGHEAFTAIRSRGASVTNVIVLVVAGDDGIMPQTIEAINHAKSAGVPMVVAINKIDKPNADVDRIKNELLAYEVVADEFGGDVICVPVSAKTGQNLDKLCEAILLQAEVFNAKAEWDAPASGTVLEGKLDKQKGVIASLLVQNGTLKTGDIVVVGSSYCKVRLMVNDRGESVQKAEPSTPIEIYGLPDVPIPGLSFNVVETEKLAKEIVEHRKEKKIEQKMDVKSAFSAFFKPKEQKKQFNIVIRADVQSTIEAIKYSIEQIKVPTEIELRIMQANVGQVTEADVNFARNYNAVIFAFSVKVGSKEEELAKKNGIIIKQHSIIYKIVDDVKEMVGAMLSPIIKDEVIGDVEVRAIFDIAKSGKIAGCMVKKGVVKRNAIVKVLRTGLQIAEGKLKTLKHFKDDVKELAQGNECGVQIEGFEDFSIGDMLQIIYRTEEKRTLE
jgi:translation initiation factor IF-2